MTLSDSEAAARLARRTSTSVSPDRVEALSEAVAGSWSKAVAVVMDEDRAVEPPPSYDGEENPDWYAPIWWWLDRMSSPDAGLGDRLAWFWHQLLTTHAEKVSSVGILVDQVEMLRSEGRGDFRTLLHRFVTSAALQQYLDGAGSLASNPNENLARELMELYTIGRGNYSEDDVKAAARALAGWVVDDDGKLEFDRSNAFIAPLIFLGHQDRWDTEMVVDRLCDHPATAARIAGRLWQHLVGTTLAPADQAELGRWWQGRELAIDPLVERILLSPAMTDPGSVRARTGLEWLCAARAATSRGTGSNEEPGSSTYWALNAIGQMPYQPPTPAGWPIDDDHWLAPGSLSGRVSGLWGLLDEAGLFDEANTDHPTSTDAIARRCGLADLSPSTRAVIDGVHNTDLDPASIRAIRWRLMLASPEFNHL